MRNFRAKVIAAQADPARRLVEPDGVVCADREDLRLVEDVEAGADLLGVAAEVGEAAAVDADLDLVGFVDGIERVVRHAAGRPGDCTGRPRQEARPSRHSMSVRRERERRAINRRAPVISGQAVEEPSRAT